MTPLLFSYLRMSSPEQLKGDSLRRQLSQAQEYADKNGFTLVEDLRDIGISAFRGANVEGGALGQFIKAVEAKKIPRGSVLCVENLDRISRQPVLQSLDLFIKIVMGGVTIVTLSDNQTYTDTAGIGQLMQSMFTFERSHQESAMRSIRLKAAYAAKRKNLKAGGPVYTTKTRGWLKARPDRKGFDAIPDHVKIVKRIFEMADEQGMGADAIARRLNKMKVPLFRPRVAGWYKISVLRILRDRAVLGEFTPCEEVDGKRVPDQSKTQQDYFPRVIDEATFHRVQAALDARRQPGGARLQPIGGRRGEHVTSLFPKLLTCADCGGPVHLILRGKPKGEAQSLMCDRAHRKVGDCEVVYWPYVQFEKAFLHFVRELDLTTLSGEDVGREERVAADHAIREFEGRLAEAVVQRQRAYDLVVEQGNAFVKDKLKELNERVGGLEKRLDSLREDRQRLAQESDAFVVSQAEIRTLVDKAQVTRGGHASDQHDEAYALRSTIRLRIGEMVENIKVRFGAKSSDRRSTSLDGYFIIIFKDGSKRIVQPDPNDPTKFLAVGTTAEGVVTDPLVRFMLRQYGVVNPSEADFEEMSADLLAAGKSHRALGHEAGTALHEKWSRGRK